MQSVARDGAVSQPSILAVLHHLLCGRHKVVGNVVEIDNHERHEACDVFGSLSALHHSLRHKGGQLMLDVSELRLELSHHLLVTFVGGLLIDTKQAAVVVALLLQLRGTNHRRHMFPRHELRLFVGERRKECHFVCHKYNYLI